MSVGATYTQLVLFDGMNVNDPEWLSKIKKLSEIPRSCDFWIFCHETNAFIEKSLKSVKNSNIRLFKSSDPVIEMFDTLYSKCISYSFIVVVCDKNARYVQNLNKITKKHDHVCVMAMDLCNVNILNIIHNVDYQKGKECDKVPEFNDRQSTPPLYSKDNLRPKANKVEHQLNNLRKILNNKKITLRDQDKNEFYCLVCDQSFPSKDIQDRHIKEGCPEATSDDDKDYE